ncbi:MAG: hypothetical protein REI12_03055 [Pedobacter sp.]|nr:hypothetical protein [Pedobacter sp.]
MGRLLATLLALLLVFPATLVRAGENQEEKAWRVVVARDVYTDYQRFVGQRDPLSLKNFAGPFSRRDVVELVLMQQALERGGANRPLRFILTDSEGRTLKALINGEADISGASSWKSSTAKHDRQLLLSRPLIREGHFMAGLYFPEGHPALKILATQPQEIRRYTAVCADSWTPDLLTLKALGSPVLKTENWESMLGMLKKQRADFVLAPFQPTAGLRLEAGDMVLTPVPGVKVSLEGSRHFLVWRKGLEAEALLKALDQGLAALEHEGTIQRAYRESGFDNTALQNWRILNR